ncbi:MAG: SDR family NAD(P)-dependent oxidoreductase [Myxococcota bacterium]
MAEAGVCVVAGVGPGTGAACSRRFAAEGYRVAMLARNRGRLEEFEASIPGTRGFPVDLTDPRQVTEVVQQVRSELGPVEVLVYNAARGTFGGFLEIEPEELEANFRVNTLGLLHLARELAPSMIEAARGSIIVTGNTSARRGKAHYAAFAPTKAAQRILAESMARDLGPKGVHVAYVVIDAVIDLPWTRKRMPERPDEFYARPDAIAETVLRLVEQDRSAWSFEVDLRPFGEEW